MTDIIQEELSIITSKRVRKEMFYFLTQSNRSGLCEGFYKPTLINIKKIQLIFLLKLKNISTITIKITPDYPFKCPEVFVNNHKYKSLLGCKNIPDLKNCIRDEQHLLPGRRCYYLIGRCDYLLPPSSKSIATSPTSYYFYY